MSTVKVINRKVTALRNSLINRRGNRTFHNYIREHEGLNGKTPAEACGITVEGRNRWLTLIQNATLNGS